MSHGHISSKSNILMSQIIYQDQREKYFVVMNMILSIFGLEPVGSEVG